MHGKLTVLRTANIAFVLGVSMSMLVSCSSKKTEFGDDSRLVDTSFTVSSAVNELSFDRSFRIQGQVATLCPDDACWILLKDGANVIRVDLSDAIVAQKPQCQAKTVVVEGILRRKLVSKNSVGFEAYEKSCSEQGAQQLTVQNGIVLEAYRLEYR